MAELFIALLCVHFVCDFNLQGRVISENKGKYYSILLIHSFTWACMLWLTKYFWTGQNSYLWLIGLTIAHAVPDKLTSMHDKTEWSIVKLLDQWAHMITIILFTLF